MSDTNRLLELIEKGIVEHGGDLGGWTRHVEGKLQLFSGRVTCHAEMNEAEPADDRDVIHAHVFTTLHEHDDEVLDACLVGIGRDREAALAEAALVWITGIAGPIKSFLDDRPVCMTCQAGVEGGDASQGYSPDDYGLPGLRAYVGPSLSRGFGDEHDQPPFDDAMPWFQFANESAAPRRVHLAKSIVLSRGNGAWTRKLEIDGHDVYHDNLDWPSTIPGPDSAYTTRYAVFEFPPESAEISRRAELERTIRFFAENYAKHESVDELMEEMVSRGFSQEFVDETEAFATIAFSRTLFEPHGVKYPATVIRARRDGRVETDVPLMSIPAYTRARALAVRLRDSLPEDDFQAVCLYNAESQVILQTMEANGEKLDLTEVSLYPCVVPERGVSEQTMNAALATLNEMIEGSREPPEKPWWKFW